jgi:methionyl-tRNA formyltransferase
MAPMLDKAMAKIEWKEKTSHEIKNLVRGLNPIMGAYTFYNGKKIKLWKVDAIDENSFEIDNYKDAVPGTILLSNSKKGLYIKAKEGIVKVLEIQGENAKRMPVGDFLRGNKMEENIVVE